MVYSIIQSFGLAFLIEAATAVFNRCMKLNIKGDVCHFLFEYFCYANLICRDNSLISLFSRKINMYTNVQMAGGGKINTRHIYLFFINL